jgi:glutamine cyclotransferase
MRPLKKFNSYHALLTSCLLAISCNNGNKPPDNNVASNAGADITVPANLPYDVVNEFPHDPTAFTEGLEFKDGLLYEGTGQYGSSDVRKTDLKTGKMLASAKMDKRYFGEGITLLDGKIYQLTYREGKGFVYDAKTLKQEGSFTFPANEGWGMTNNGACLIFDDGTNVMHYLDPKTFKEVKQLRVTDEHGPVNYLNEPELIHGFIYANQWQTDLILKIDTTTGRVFCMVYLYDQPQKRPLPPLSTVGRGAAV